MNIAIKVRLALAACSASLTLSAQVDPPVVLPPFNADYRIEPIGGFPGGPSAVGPLGGGMAISQSSPNTLFYGDTANGLIQAVPLLRSGPGQEVTGFGTPQLAPVAPAPNLALGLAIGPAGTLFYTTTNDRLGQLVAPFGSSPPFLSQPVMPFIPGSICTFVPGGLSGAGRCKVLKYTGATFFDVALTPVGAGTFQASSVGSGVTLLPSGVSSCFCYPRFDSPQLGNHLLMGRWASSGSTGSRILAYPLDPNGDPIVGQEQLLATNIGFLSGGVTDPVTGEILFFGESNGAFQGWVLRRQPTPCGLVLPYGVSSPGSGVEPTVDVVGCPRIGDMVTIEVSGDASGLGTLGVLAVGTSSAHVTLANLTVLTNSILLVGVTLGSSGQGAVPLQLPPDPSLAYSDFYFQAAFLDPSTLSGLKASAGVEMSIR